MDDKEKAGIGQIGFMQGTVIVYSFSGVFQKLASRYPMISIQFLLFYGCSIGILFVYAVLWQMILRKVPLTTAYSNRAVSMIWSMVWSVLLFQESTSWNQILGAIVICYGIYKVMASGDKLRVVVFPNCDQLCSDCGYFTDYSEKSSNEAI